MKTVGLYLIEALQAFGVEYVFGIPGVHNLELYRGLAKGPIRHITGRHEQGVGFMADGYARVSGKPGVCFTITGPGLTNIATAMGQAYGDSIPLLVISSQNRRGEAGSGRGFLHELPNQQALAGGVAAASFSVTTAAELPLALGRAFSLFASGRPRPVYIEIPLDVLAADASGLRPPKAPEVRVSADEMLIEFAAKRLRDAESVVILAGGGAVGAATEVSRMAERLDAPVVMTVNARGILPTGHPLAVPISPTFAPVRALVAAAEVVLAVGTEFGPTDYVIDPVGNFPNPAQLIRIDVDAEQLNRGALPTVGLCGDAGTVLRQIEASDIGPARKGDGASRAATTSAAGLKAVAAAYPKYPPHIEVLELIRKTLPSAVLVGDSTQLVYAGNLGFNVNAPRTWFNSATGYGTLGYAVPASTGASLAARNRPIVCLVGDGGLQFSLSELAVLRDADAWTAVVIWNNQGYGEIRNSMLAVGITPEGVDVKPPRFADIARAYDYSYELISTREALRTALENFGRHRQIVVLEIAAADFA